MKRMTGVALMLGMLPLNAVSLGAAEIAGLDDSVNPEVNVSNNSWSPVEVYVEDSLGGLHPLGRLDRNRFRLFEIPAEVTDLGDFRVKVYPQESDVWSLRSLNGIKTKPLHPQEGELVILLLEKDLKASVVLFDNG